jgi:hypothetical protein
MSNFQRTANWLHAAQKQVGNSKHLAVQVGVHLEEIAELLDELGIVGSGSDNDSLEMASTRIKGLAHRLKQGQTGIVIRNRVRALDALCDSEVTGNGVAYLAGFKKEEADERVLSSNESKLNADGTAVILPGGKIGKGPLYKAPSLADLT